MKANIARRFAVAGILGVLTTTALGCAPQVTVVPSHEGDPARHAITVIGRGEASGRPDVARANVGVEVSAPTVAEATRLNAQRMSELIAALKRAGVAEKDIQTSNFSVVFERPYDMPPMPYGMPSYGPAGPPMPLPAPPPAPPPPAAPPGGKGRAPVPAVAPAPAIPVMPPMPAGMYKVTNTVDMKIRALDRVGAVLDAAVAAGANNIWGISFGVDDTDALEAQAREKAIEDARARAVALAKLQGVALGEVVAISEAVSMGMPMPMPMFAAKDAAAGTPVAPGEVTFGTQVQVIYTLKPAAR